MLRPGRNPLARDVDRVESTIVILFVVIALVLVPVMLTFGSVTFTSLTEQGSRESTARYESVATLTEDAPVTSVGTQGEVFLVTAKVAATWQLLDRTTRTGLVDAAEGLKAGAEVPVWLDESGAPAKAPLSTADAAVAGVLVATVGWFATVGLFAMVFWVLHRVLDQRRFRAWDAEWARMSGGVA